MKTWYCVTSSFDNRGRVTANITATKEAETCPESTIQVQAEKTFTMIGLKAWMKPKPLRLNPNVHSKPPGRQQDRPAIKTATPSMGGARVRSPYKQLTGCNGGRCGTV